MDRHGGRKRTRWRRGCERKGLCSTYPPRTVIRIDSRRVNTFSVVDFLVTHYGREKMLNTLSLLREGAATGAALSTVYGFDEIGLETAWRAHVGAKPLATSAGPGATGGFAGSPIMEPLD